jgi:TatD DNase family protein
MAVLTDTHCHLDFDRFDEDRERVIARAEKQGLTHILVPGIDLSSSRAAVALAEKHEMVYAAVGVHPNSGTSWTADTRKQLASLAGHPKVVAIGEIGLDYYRDWTPQALQRKIFREQLGLAAESGLPVIIHNREAFEDVVPLLVAWQEDLAEEGAELAQKPGVLHSYSGSIMQAEPVLNSGYYLGFTGPVTFKNAVETQEAAQKMPLEKMLIETDSPYLTPHPFRGKRNEPSYVYYVAEKIATLRGLSPAEVGEITSRNAKLLFDW